MNYYLSSECLCRRLVEMFLLDWNAGRKTNGGIKGKIFFPLFSVVHCKQSSVALKSLKGLMLRRHSVSMETLYLGEKHPDCSKMFFLKNQGAKCPLCPRSVSKPSCSRLMSLQRGEVEGHRRPIYKLPFMSFHNSSHTSEHTQRCGQTWTNQTLFRDSCLESQNSGWPHCCRDEWFVWSIWKKKSFFQSVWRSSGMRSTERSRRWKQSECLWWISCHCHPDSRWPAAPPPPPRFVHSEVSVFNQWWTITGKGNGERGHHHFSLLVSVFPTPICICAHCKARKTSETHVWIVY